MQTDRNTIQESLNVASYFLDHNISEGRGDRTAIHYKDKAYSYNEIFRMTNKIGNIFKELGVEVENRVYLVLDDSPELVANYYASIKIGAIPTIGYVFFSSKDFFRELENIRPKVVVVNKAYLNRLREAIKVSRYVKHLLVVGDSSHEFELEEYDYYKMFESADSKLEAEPTHRDDIAIWGVSGGTTGLRKFIPHYHSSVVFAYEAYNHIIKYEQDDVILAVPKLFFGYARTASILFPFRTGSAAVLFPERTTTAKIFELIRKFKPTILINSPTMMRKMLQIPKEERYDLSCLRFCTSSGEHLPAALYREWVETFGCEVLNGIGSGEMFYNFTLNSPGKAMPGSVGKPLPGYEVKVVNERGNELPDNEIGTLAIKGGSSGTYYIRNYEKSKKTFRGEWVYTNDLFFKDRKGFLYFHSRKDDLLKVSGYFVSPLEIEECIGTHTDVAMNAVVGVKDADGLIKTKAFIVLKNGISPSESIAVSIKKYTKKNLSPHKYPRFIEFVSELPLTRTGKINRRKLKDKKSEETI